MTTLAIMEHLQKIPYLLSLFFPIILFFTFGLFLAYRRWSPDVSRLRKAIAENARLSREVAEASATETALGETFQAAYQKHWDSHLKEHQQELDKGKESASSGELEALRFTTKELQSSLKNAEDDLTVRQGKIDVLQKKIAQFEDDKGPGQESQTEAMRALEIEASSLRSQLAAFKETHPAPASDSTTKTDPEQERKLQDTQNELEKLRDSLRAAEEASAGHQSETEDLRSQLAALESKPNPKETQKLEETQKELEKLNDSLQAAQKANADHRSEAEDLRSQLAALESKPDHKETQKLEETQKELEKLRDSLQVAREASAGHRNEAEGLRSQLAAFESKPDRSSELAEKNAEIAKLKEELEKSEQKSSVPVRQESFPFSADTSKASPLGNLFSSPPDDIDDLKLIKGVGPVLEEKLHLIGVYQFQQISSWTPDQIKAFGKLLSFKDRIQRDDWLSQASDFHREKYGS